jgi:hypothetical protein
MLSSAQAVFRLRIDRDEIVSIKRFSIFCQIFFRRHEQFVSVEKVCSIVVAEPIRNRISETFRMLVHPKLFNIEEDKRDSLVDWRWVWIIISAFLWGPSRDLYTNTTYNTYTYTVQVYCTRISQRCNVGKKEVSLVYDPLPFLHYLGPQSTF